MPTYDECVNRTAQYEEAVRQSYKRSSEPYPDQYENKCASNPDATKKIAYYLNWTDYPIIDLDLEDGREEVHGLVETLFDFLNFTDGI